MWVWQRVMGYLPVTDRVAALRRFVDGGGLSNSDAV